MRVGAGVLVIVTGAALDLATKAWARSGLEAYGPAIDFLPFLSLRLTFNQGVSFSMLSSEEGLAQATLVGVTAFLTVAMAIWAYRSQGWQRAGLSAIVAGALANLIDRSARGSVTDFLGLHFGEWHPFVFNLADVWISIGAVILLAAPVLQAKQVRDPVP